MAEARVKAIITAEDRASATLKGFGNNANRLGSILKRVFATAAIIEGARRLTGFIWDSVQAFAQEEIAVNRLQHGIGNVTSARNKDVSALIEQASALQAVTRFADEQIISAQGILTTYQLNQKAIALLTPRLVDMAEGIATVDGGMADLEGTAHLVAKAIGGEDVVGLAGSLRRVGVIMTKHQTEVLKTGTMQERLSIITKILDQNFKGMGKAAGETTSGAMAQLQNALGDLQEEFGKAIAHAITPFIKKLTTWAKTDEARQTIRKIAEGVVSLGKAAANFMRDVWPTLKVALKSFATLVSTIADSVDRISGALARLPEPPAWFKDMLKGGVKMTIPGLKFLPGFANGVENFSGGPAIVGERGPELVNLPSGSSVIPTDKIGGNINITVQAGTYMGSKADARRFAREILSNLQDIANMRGISVSKLIENNNGIPA